MVKPAPANIRSLRSARRDWTAGGLIRQNQKRRVFHGFKTYAEINLDNLAYNIGRIREKVAPSALIPIIKADAYGHGAIPVAKRLAREGCAMFAVARLEEAMELRESGITQRSSSLAESFRTILCRL